MEDQIIEATPADPADRDHASEPSAPPPVRQLAERVEARLGELDNRPVSAHGDVYAAIHAELSQALERLDA